MRKSLCMAQVRRGSGILRLECVIFPTLFAPLANPISKNDMAVDAGSRERAA